MTGDPKLQAFHLSKMYGNFHALKDVSFSVKEGEVFGILGPNGAGKSTCIKIFVDLLHPTRGQAFVDGIDVRKEPLAAKEKLGYLPEFPSLFEHLTGDEFLRLLGGLRKLEPDVISERIEWFAEVLNLKSKMEEPAGTYSKGMKQKLAFAAAVFHDPEILILDEPTSGLDPQFGRIVKDIIQDLSGKGRTVLLSTHITSIAESLCDRVGIISDGKLAALGTLEEINSQADAESLEDAFINIVGGTKWSGSLFTARKS